MKSIEEVFDIGIEEYLDNAFLCIIEWPEIYEEELADFPHHEIKLKITIPKDGLISAKISALILKSLYLCTTISTLLKV